MNDAVWRVGEDSSVELLSKCLLFPLDGSTELPRTVDFLIRLYPGRNEINLILCYFMPQLAPIYRETTGSQVVARKREEQLQARAREARSLLDKARKVLMNAGFSPQAVVEQIQERSSGVARQACMLAGLRSVDAVLVQKDSSSSLEAFLKDDPASGMLKHCLTSPIWLVDGTVDISRAAVCVSSDSASLRAVDHAAYMLAATSTQLEILHFSSSVSYPVRLSPHEPISRLSGWLGKTEGGGMLESLQLARDCAMKAGMEAGRVHLSVLPSKGHGRVPAEILEHCHRHQIGIVALGHSQERGSWGFLKGSIARRLMAGITDMAVWVAQ